MVVDKQNNHQSSQLLFQEFQKKLICIYISVSCIQNNTTRMTDMTMRKYDKKKMYEMYQFWTKVKSNTSITKKQMKVYFVDNNVDINKLYDDMMDSKSKEIEILVDSTKTEGRCVNDFDIMRIIDKPDLELLENHRVVNMSRIDWGKSIAISNQYIQRNILKSKLEPFGYKVFSTDDADLPEVNISNNSPGFDLLIVTPDNKQLRVQSKLRQVKGNADYSQAVHFETTRRNSKKNENKNHTGHVCYSVDEFEYVMISLVNDRKNREVVKNCNLWSYAFVHVSKLIDKVPLRVTTSLKLKLTVIIAPTV